MGRERSFGDRIRQWSREQQATWGRGGSEKDQGEAESKMLKARNKTLLET